MLLAGDELGRTQRGNNKAYCQDNETSWVDWNLDEGAKDLFNFTRMAIRLRKQHPILRRKSFFRARSVLATPKEIIWLRPDGSEIEQESWESSMTRKIAMVLVGDAMEEFNDRGETISDDTFLMLLNATHEPVVFTIPQLGSFWEMILSTLKVHQTPGMVKSGGSLRMEGRSEAVLRMIA